MQSRRRFQRTRAAGGLCAEGCCGLTYVFVLNSILFIWLCWVLVVACGVEVADQGWNPSPLHWEYRVLATGPPGKSLTCVLKARSGCCSEMRLQGGKGRSREMCQETITREREAGGLGQDNSRAWKGESGQILDRSYFIMKIFKHCESRESDT